MASESQLGTQHRGLMAARHRRLPGQRLSAFPFWACLEQWQLCAGPSTQQSTREVMATPSLVARALSSRFMHICDDFLAWPCWERKHRLIRPVRFLTHKRLRAVDLFHLPLSLSIRSSVQTCLSKCGITVIKDMEIRTMEIRDMEIQAMETLDTFHLQGVRRLCHQGLSSFPSLCLGHPRYRGRQSRSDGTLSLRPSHWKGSLTSSVKRRPPRAATRLFTRGLQPS